MPELSQREQLRYIINRLREGGTYEGIADELGMHPVSVRRLVPKKNLEKIDAALKFADQGYTYEQIGGFLGVTKQRVQQLIGKQPDVASRGKEVVIDAAPSTFSGVLRVANGLGIPVRTVRGTDARAITALLDGIATGQFIVSPRR